MRILIIGGTRFFGYATAIALHDDGHEVTVFTRGRREADLPDGVRHVVGDREDDSDLSRAASEVEPEFVWDNISYNAAHARSAIEIFGDADLFIHTSTLAVYSVCAGIHSPYREEDYGRGRPLEDRRGRYPYDYGLDRRDGEDVFGHAFEERGFPRVSVRLPVVIGPRDYTLRAWSYWRRIAEGRPLILPDAGAEMHRSIYSGDVVQAIRLILAKGAAAAGQEYNFAGHEIVSLRRFVELSADAMGREAEIVEIPWSALDAAGLDPEALSPFSTWRNHLHSIRKARRDLGFEPTPVEEWLGPSIEWHREHRSETDPPGWELVDREGHIISRWRDFMGQLE